MNSPRLGVASACADCMLIASGGVRSSASLTRNTFLCEVPLVTQPRSLSVGDAPGSVANLTRAEAIAAREGEGNHVRKTQ